MTKSHFLKVAQVTLFFFVLAPLLTFVHEMGHALLPLLNGETMIVSVGSFGGSPQLELGPLALHYGGPWQPWLGFADWSGETAVFRLAMGPLTSLALAFLFFYLLRKYKNTAASLLLTLSFLWVAGAFLVTAIPYNFPSSMNNPTKGNDSKQIVDLLFPPVQP